MNHNTNEEKTEHPTEYRIQKNYKKGKTRYSREMSSLIILLSGCMNLWWYRDVISLKFSKIFLNGFVFNRNNIINSDSTLLELFISLKEVFFIFIPFFISLLIVTIVPSIIFSGVAFNFKSLNFNLKKINPYNGLKRIFSFQIFIESFKIILKLCIVSSISFWYLWISFSEILLLINKNYITSLLHGFNIIATCCIFVVLGLIPIVFFDIIWQQWNYYKKLRMTHKEIKDELKEKEGHPSIKMWIRQEMKAVIRRRMIADIPKADVIITNPIHYSVALKYDEKKMNAPKVIAKGVGVTAIKIKNIALKNNIAIISAPSLARSLYRYVKIGQHIPSVLYQSVAEVLAWVWKVRKWKKEGGNFPEKPKNIIVPSELNFRGEHKTND